MREPLECSVEGLNGTVRTCLLADMDPQAQIAHFRLPPDKTVFPIRFSQFRRLTLRQHLQPVARTGAAPRAVDQLLNHRPVMNYTVQLAAGGELSGNTVGHVETGWGLFLFPPVDDAGTVQQVFVPRPAYTDVRFGALIGQVLVEQQAVTEHQIEAATQEQTELRSRKLGDYLVLDQVVSSEQLTRALEQQSRMPMVRIGEALTALGLISEAQLAQALDKQKQEHNLPLGELLVRGGVLTRQALQSALARKMGYPVVDVTHFPLEESALRRVPLTLARRLNFMPLTLHDGVLAIAIEDPSQQRLIQEIEFIVNVKVAPALGDPAKIALSLPTAYEKISPPEGPEAGLAPADGSTGPAESSAAETSKLVESLELQHQIRQEAEPEQTIEQSDNSLVRLINTLIADAHGQGVSDIHIEVHPGQRKVRVRFRRDGVMSLHLELPPSYRSALVARIKIMADLDISERRKPQDGKIEFAKFSPQHRIELRVATIPTSGGLEDVVMRLLASAKPLPLEQLGLSEGNFQRLREAVERPYGMVLCVGPTGSGKTTTLHSVLGALNTPERKIWTAEDPVEITQPDLRQVQVNPKIGWTFAKALRAFLRADPDVIMVGEIRDQETAQMAIEASLTGHLVLSTLHTNSAPETITRLLDMGMDPFNFGDSLLAVLAQRLIRRLCSACKQRQPMAPATLAELLDDYLHGFPDGLQPDRDALLQTWVQRFGHEGQLMHTEAPGCSHCQGSGLKGRVGVHELMVTSPELRHLIQTGARAEQLQHEAMAHGHLRTLRQDGIEKVLAGLTTLQEVRANCS
jgi:type II secretory ATPase GspE/PulE/Tfp pilus assembly ATPase PilB-like protein